MRRRLLIFAVLAGLQILTPLALIAWREHILEAGTRLKFATAPVDPVDALRGRYLSLSMAENVTDLDQAVVKARTTRRLYVRLAPDAQGFARITGLSATRPSGGLYIRARVQPQYFPAGPQTRIVWPFERYYLSERLAPQAERVYRQHVRPGKRAAYVTVRVLHGRAALEEVYVAGQALPSLLRAPSAKP